MEKFITTFVTEIYSLTASTKKQFDEAIQRDMPNIALIIAILGTIPIILKIIKSLRK